MTNEAILHHVPHSRSFRVLFLLCELGIPCRRKIYRIGDKAMRAEDYLARSPAGRVPALEIDGQTLFESGAIVQYLCETRSPHTLGRAADHPERAAYLTWLHYAETMGSLIENLNLQWIFLRDPAMRSDVVVKLLAARLAKTLDPLEKALGDHDYLLPSGFSAADVMFSFNLFAVPHFVRLAPYPNIRAYWDRLNARPAFQEALKIEGPQTFYAQDFYEVQDG